MAAAAAASSPKVRYAPADPSLPKPWRGLVDGNTGNLYFWNPDTNVTQYERPLPPPHAPNSLPPDDNPSQHFDSNNKATDGGEDKVASEAQPSQTETDGPDCSLNKPEPKTKASWLNPSKGVEGGTSVAPKESGMSPEAYRKQHEITVTGDNVPQPFISFQSTGFPPEVLREFQQAGFSAPTPIQAQSWPIAIQGRDIVAIAKTGSGKTLGYLLPGFHHLKQRGNNPKLGPTVLVLSPTRELATQIQDEAVKFGKSSKISCTCLYGGAPKGPQLKDLDRGVDIVVATPGRLNDILEARRIALHQVSYLVLDEADRMLDMGFEPQIRKIVKEVPSRRQTLMYTATWPREVRRIAADLLTKPVQVNIGNTDELAANKAITQHVEVLTSMDKRRRVEQILRSQEPGSKIIIFCSTKKMCDMLSGNLNRQFGAAAIHGDKNQSERDNVLNQFRTGRSPILVATDVAARGLDIKDIRVVINYDFPTGVEDYVHRIGRTGRAGATGEAYTFFTSQDEKHAPELIKLLERADQKVPADLRDMGSRGGGGGMGRGYRRWSSGPSGYDGGNGGSYNSGNDGGNGGSYNSGYDGGHGGNFNSSTGGGGGWGMSSTPNGGGYGNAQENSEGGGGSGGYKSFHESMMGSRSNNNGGGNSNNNNNTNIGRSRSRSPPPSVRSSSPSPIPNSGRLSFHEAMMQQQQQGNKGGNGWGA